MEEVLYDQSSIVIAGALLLAILAANEAGYRLGRWQRARHDTGAKAQTSAIQAAMLGLLALLLGFTFTMALQRFDNRSQAVISEANAIGTAYLRTQLLPEEYREPARKLINDYLQLCISTSKLDLTEQTERRRAQDDVQRMQDAMWSIALAAAEQDARPVTTGLFIQSLNELIDVYGERNAALRKHVPEVVLFLLFAVFIIAGAVLGFSGGLEGGRPLLATVAMSMLIVLVIFIIIDLDRPRRGLIEVNQDSMLDLGAAMAPAAVAASGNSGGGT